MQLKLSDIKKLIKEELSNALNENSEQEQKLRAAGAQLLAAKAVFLKELAPLVGDMAGAEDLDKIEKLQRAVALAMQDVSKSSDDEDFLNGMIQKHVKMPLGRPSLMRK